MEEFTGNNVIIGYRLALKMGLIPGDEITLISPNGKITAFGTVPRMKSYRIAGTFLNSACSNTTPTSFSCRLTPRRPFSEPATP